MEALISDDAIHIYQKSKDVAGLWPKCGTRLLLACVRTVDVMPEGWDFGSENFSLKNVDRADGQRL